jgi:hypothetical protein
MFELYPVMAAMLVGSPHIPDAVHVVVQPNYTIEVSTSLAPDVYIGLDLQEPTGGIVVHANGAPELVRSTLSYLAATAVLPINAEHERRVDDLVARRLMDLKTKPLTRRV